MKKSNKRISTVNLKAQIKKLKARLRNAEDTLHAIQSGEIDALVVNGEKGNEQIFTLKTADHPYRVLVESMSEGALTLNENGVIFYCNQRFAEMLGVSLDKIIGSLFESHVCEEDRLRFGEMLKEADNARTKNRLHLKMLNGDTISSMVSMGRLDIEWGGAISVVATDLTEQDLLIAAKASVDELNIEKELRERFVSTLSHDLRNPLSAAKTSAQLILRYPDALERHAVLGNRIVHSIERADKMIQDLLDVNKLRAGHRLPLKIDECDLFETAKNTLEELSMSVGDRFLIEGVSPVIGYWSSDQLRRVIENLATNAVKYGSESKPVRVKLLEIKNHVHLAVHNEGGVISKAEQNDIFKPFLRTRSAEHSGTRGWGLGLTLVRGVTEAHGGKVEVQSSKEHGTTFTVILPKDSRPFQTLPVSGSHA